MRLRKKFFTASGVSLWVLAVLFALLPVWPHIYYRISPQASETLASTIAYTVTEEAGPIDQPSISPSPTITPTPTPITKPLPDFDPSLPDKNGLIIDKIGVRGELHEGSDWKNILRQGIWRVPNFSTPDLASEPIILAAHRWGYLEWSSSFRKLNSFYSLPQLKIGDKIKVVWEQREYEYTVYSTETGTGITDYKANIILYTCQLWNSPVRYFVYANRSN